MGGGDVLSSLMRNLVMSMLLERGIHPSMPKGIVDADLLGDISF